MLLQNAQALQYKNSKIIFEKMDIRIRNRIIYETGPFLQPIPGEESVDLRGDMVLPGMVNSHYHSYTNILRGTAFGEPLELWSHDTVALGGILTDEDMAISTSIGICEMIRAGVTACVDHLPHLKTSYTAAEIYESSGFKVGLAPMLHNIRDCDMLHGFNETENSSSPFPTVHEYIDFYEDFISRFHKPNENIQIMLGINSPQRADSKLLKACSDLSYKFNLPIHSHLLETKWQRISADHSYSPLKILDQFELLGEKTSLAHCIWLNKEELDLVAERKAMPISNPTSNSFLGSGVFPSDEYLKRNIPLALGSDGVNCGSNHNMLEILRFFILLQRTREQDYNKWITLKDGFQMVTKNGYDVLNFPISSGLIKANYAADLVVVNKNNFLDILDDTLANQMIFHSSPLSVKHVLINGEFVMKDEIIIGINEEELRKEIRDRKPYLKKSMTDALKSTSNDKQNYLSAYQKLKLK